MRWTGAANITAPSQIGDDFADLREEVHQRTTHYLRGGGVPFAGRNRLRVAALALVFLLASGCVSVTHSEKFGWQEPFWTFSDFPQSDVSGFNVAETRFTFAPSQTTNERTEPVIPLMEMKHPFLGSMWVPGKFGLERVHRGPFTLHYPFVSMNEGGRDIAPELEILCFLEFPMTLDSVRRGFAAFATNVTIVTRAEADRWSVEAFPDEEQERLDWTPPPGTTYEYSHSVPVRVALRLDKLFDEQPEPEQTTPAGLGRAQIRTGAWVWEFFLMQRSASTDELDLTIDAGGRTEFLRRASDRVGREQLENELVETFRALELKGPASSERAYGYERVEHRLGD